MPNQSKAEQELILKVAQWLADENRQPWHTLTGILAEKQTIYIIQAKEILTLIKEAVYVKLAEDQSLPSYHYEATLEQEMKDATNYLEIFWLVREHTQQDMLKESWRKVILEGKDGLSKMPNM